LFLVANDTLVTPPVSDNNLTGITRDSAMTIASNQLNMNILERRIRRSELYFADEVFLTGTAAHIQSVGELDKRTIGSGGPGKIAGKINDIYQSAIRGKNDQYIDWCIGIDV
jgi:branched-chain amino acid aminotransferase